MQATSITYRFITKHLTAQIPYIHIPLTIIQVGGPTSGPLKEHPNTHSTLIPNERGTLVLASLSKEIGEFVEASSLPMVSDSSEVTSKLRQSTSLLVRAFVDMHASHLSAAVLTATENAPWTKSPMSKLAFCSQIANRNIKCVTMEILLCREF